MNLKDVEGSGHGLIKVQSQNMSGSEENHKNTFVRTASVCVKIQTKHLLSISLERYALH